MPIVCFVTGLARADDTTDDKSDIQGVWVLSKGETNGRPLSEVFEKRGFGGLKVKFAGDVMSMTGSGAPKHTYRFVLDPMSRPKAMKLVTIETHGKVPKGSVLHGIYEIKDEKLKLCLPADSYSERPEKFEAPSGSRSVLLVLDRQPDDDKPRAEP